MTDSDLSKADQLSGFAREKLQPIDADYVIGRCKECQSIVWISVSLRPFGMAESCEEHEPLCHFVEGFE